MKKNYLWLILNCLIIILLVLSSCATKTTSTTTVTPTTTQPASKPATVPTTNPTVTTPATSTTAPSPATGKWWEAKWGAPQYGGTITIRLKAGPTYFDPWSAGSDSPSGLIESLYMETTASVNWTLDRSTWDYKVSWLPIKYKGGGVVENWEMPDTSTFIMHVRKGILWQNKPPVNGRELTAKDVEYTFHRQLGMGSSFTKPSPFIGLSTYAPIQSVTATDKYTITAKSKYPTLGFEALLSSVMYNQIVPREAVELYGDLSDWKRAVGTGRPIMSPVVQ